MTVIGMALAGQDQDELLAIGAVDDVDDERAGVPELFNAQVVGELNLIVVGLGQVPPPGEGLITVTRIFPDDAMSAAVIAAVN
jgi:hypothetical protein